MNLKLAYELKEEYRNFNHKATLDNAREWLFELIQKFKESNILEFREFWNLLDNWFEEIINSFNRVNGWRISNGPIERINRDIKMIFYNVFGVYNFIRTRNRVMYSLNKNESIMSIRKKETNKQSKHPRGNYRK